jgi:hypothetical protein
MYLHQIAEGQGTNQIATFNSTLTAGFGTTAINDWLVLDGPQPSNATIVGRTKGMHVQADVAGPGWFNYFTMVFQGGRYFPCRDFDFLSWSPRTTGPIVFKILQF